MFVNTTASQAERNEYVRTANRHDKPNKSATAKVGETCEAIAKFGTPVISYFFLYRYILAQMWNKPWDLVNMVESVPGVYG